MRIRGEENLGGEQVWVSKNFATGSWGAKLGEENFETESWGANRGNRDIHRYHNIKYRK